MTFDLILSLLALVIALAAAVKTELTYRRLKNFYRKKLNEHEDLE